ncbi:arsenate reductase ArsC [Agromyces bauzanensis]|uniref:Low molecular weight phosphatase family protein n=1 Tax=Agromyces bauzanensis TaxID=1308924 RepID=A0A917PJK2_9MICO|nr:arsenate reductase ArsC [Agromyces bauzanensis]GGJ80656.1 low molecular weight phosphatase family protein [Agromyces bauzanensis]
MNDLDSATAGRRALPGLSYPERYLRDLALELTERYDGTFNAETVERYVLESYTALLRTATVKTHLANRVIRFANDRLKALAQAKGAVVSGVPEVLFVCVQNAGRSQMAAVLTQALAGDRVHVRSAGSMPAARLNPAVVQSLEELGLDVTQEFPKPLTDDVVQAADVVVSMGCGDACPVYPGKRYLDWKLDDPEQLPLDEVRRVRDEVRAHVEALLGELGVAAR